MKRITVKRALVVSALALSALCLALAPTLARATAQADSDGLAQAPGEQSEPVADGRTDGELTSFKIANGDIALDGVDAYQIRVPSTSLEWETNPGAAFDIVSVVVGDPEVASVNSYTDQLTGEKVWSVAPGMIGGTTMLTAVAADKSNPDVTFTDTVTVTCTPGEGWLPAQDFTIGENGTLEVSLSWADQGGYNLFGLDFMSGVYHDVSAVVDDPSIARVEDGGFILTPLKSGSTGITVTVTDKFYGGTKTARATLEVTDGPITASEPWVPGQGATLLPYTLKDGILTFDGVPSLGEWYQLDIKCDDGVSYNGTIAGGTSKTMTIDRTLLHEDDPLFDPNGYTNAPVWTRGDAGEDCTSLAFTIPTDEGVDYRLEPADAGRLYTFSARDGWLTLGVQLDKPATLVVEKSDTVTVSNSDGATMTAPVSSENPNYYNNLTLVTEHIGEEPAQAATNAVVAAVDGVTGHPYVFDIHLLDPAQNVVQPLDGDSVTVTMPIPEGLSAEGLHVFHVADDGTVTDMGATVDAEAGTVSFTTTHFSTFVLANVTVETGHSGGQGAPVQPAGGQGESGHPTSDQSEGAGQSEGIPATGDPAAVASLLTAGLGAVALLGGRVIRKRR